ncbi:hypothetical protein F5880DRAFT_1490152 [Lentinula raphanica]|nr:hypothetical protein F5880DRAFT_1490152 [Lentinula raphanica]
MLEWVKRRNLFLKYLMTVKGRLRYVDGLCAHCASAEALYRCRDCHSMELLCQSCCLSVHSSKPLDRIEKWTGSFFKRVSLQSLGLSVQMGHDDGSTCPNPTLQCSKFTVVHMNGIHVLSLKFCGCPRSVQHEPWAQLLLCEWYPATIFQPQTAFTFQVLELFQLLNFEGKVTAYHFY